MRVTKELSFAYGHRLSNYDGKCKMIHGHNARLSVTVERKQLDETGFVIDFGDLKKELQKISDIFDHKTILNQHDDLNTALRNIVPEDWIVWFDVNPTAENIASYIAHALAEEILADTLVVRLWETNTSYAEYSIDNTK